MKEGLYSKLKLRIWRLKHFFCFVKTYSNIFTWKRKVRVRSSNPRVTSSNPRIRRLKARLLRLKARVRRLKERVGAIKR